MIATKLFDFKQPFIFSSERTIQEGAYRSYLPFVASNSILKAPAKSEFYLELFNKCYKFCH